MEHEELRLLIRAKVQDGRLPRDRGPSAFGLPGDGDKCDACWEILTAAVMMMEIYSHAAGRTVRFHADCYSLWEAERRTLNS